MYDETFIVITHNMYRPPQHGFFPFVRPIRIGYGYFVFIFRHSSVVRWKLVFLPFVHVIILIPITISTINGFDTDTKPPLWCWVNIITPYNIVATSKRIDILYRQQTYSHIVQSLTSHRQHRDNNNNNNNWQCRAT